MSMSLRALANEPSQVPAWNQQHPAPRPYPKVLLYSHDTVGLGNIRRTLLLAQTLTEQWENAAILILTGSPMIHAFRIPEGIDYIKLPCVDRLGADEIEPRFLVACANEVKRTRAAILTRSIMGFAPDLLVVDKRPAGVDGELVDALRALRRSGRSTKVVLGIRDILDEPIRTRNALRRTRAFETIARYYDEVWIYGERDVFDPVAEYGFPSAVAARTHFCGYLERRLAMPLRDGGPPRVLVTPGGGGDGGAMISAYLEGLVDLPRRVALRSTVIFGPQMSAAHRSGILERYGHLADVTFVDFEADLTPRYAESDLVVSMAGYNTVCELLSNGLPAVLVPRAEPVREQLMRARLLAERGWFDVVEPQDLSPSLLMEKVMSALQRTPRAAPPLGMDGLGRVRERACRLLEDAAS
ncbi:MAG TPA: glycosyltransferase [Gemmatimonadaceae bacterium]|nr:glycosyltransferase [Gemmatimonadaceae bacterium]